MGQMRLGLSHASGLGRHVWGTAWLGLCKTRVCIALFNGGARCRCKITCRMQAVIVHLPVCDDRHQVGPAHSVQVTVTCVSRGSEQKQGGGQWLFPASVSQEAAVTNKGTAGHCGCWWRQSGPRLWLWSHLNWIPASDLSLKSPPECPLRRKTALKCRVWRCLPNPTV